MKFILMCLLSTNLAHAGTRLDRMATYAEIQKLEYVDGDTKKALELAKQLAREVPEQDPLSISIQEMISQLDKNGSQDRLQRAIRFVTGTKTETYCKGVGLVESLGTHNDGTKSRLTLVKSNRKLIDGYSQMNSGDWIYELSNDYRPVTRSDLFVIGSKNAYKVSEIRQITNGRLDRGVYVASWDNNNFSNSFSTSGEVVEPAPMYMANDFHLWGNRDLGYQITFKVGAVSHSSGVEDAGVKRMRLESTRRVSAFLPTYEYSDSKNERHAYQDCFKVDYTIVLKDLVDKSANN